MKLVLFIPAIPARPDAGIECFGPQIRILRKILALELLVSVLRCFCCFLISSLDVSCLFVACVFCLVLFGLVCILQLCFVSFSLFDRLGETSLCDGSDILVYGVHLVQDFQIYSANYIHVVQFKTLLNLRLILVQWLFCGSGEHLACVRGWVVPVYWRIFGTTGVVASTTRWRASR